MLKNWLSTFKTSLIQPKEYGKLSQRTFWSGYWYLFLLITIGILFNTIIFVGGIVSSVPKVKTKLPLVKTQMRNAYPAELEVSIKNGVVTTNVQEPYVISLQQVIPQFTQDEKTTLLVIDTTANVENYPMQKTLFLLTRNSLAYPSRNDSGSGSYEIFPLNEIKEPITINKSLYDKGISYALPYVDKVPQFMYGFAVFALFMFPLFGGFFILNGSLLYLLVMTLVLLIISKIMKRQFTYGSLFKASVFGLTVPLVVTFLTGLLKLEIPSLYNLLFLGWMICVLTLNRGPVYTENNAKSKTVSSRKTLSSRSRRS